MGAATAGEPGEAWAYRCCRWTCRRRSTLRARRVRAAAGRRRARTGQLVFERASDADSDWTIAETPLDEEGPALPRDGSPTASRRGSPRTAAGCSSARTPRARRASRSVVLARDPGGRFQVLPEPPAGVLLGGRRRRRPERGGARRRGRQRARSPTRPSKTKATPKRISACSGAAATRAVVRWNGTEWSREPVELPAGYAGSLHDRRARRHLARRTCGCSARPARRADWASMLFKRVGSRGRSQVAAGRTGLGAVLARARTPAQDVSGVAPLSGQAQPLTVYRTGRVDRRQPAGAGRRQRRV